MKTKRGPVAWLGRTALASIGAGALLAGPAAAQVDSTRAQVFFGEALARCDAARRLWGVSLCGPMVFADPRTGTLAASEPIPDEPKPRAMGFANTALSWGGRRWSTFVWPMLASLDSASRLKILLHELFHRIQPDLGLLVTALPGENDHLDQALGRYWMRLEWRALGAALESGGEERADRIRDATAFRRARRAAYPGAAASEAPSEINEGLAQYTATVLANPTAEEARVDVIAQLAAAPEKESFVRTFAYPSGAAYGLLLDDLVPGWRASLGASDDLAALLLVGTGLTPADDPAAAARRYDGPAMLRAERAREAERESAMAALRKRFVEGPVLVVPRGRGASFVTTGVTPLPGAGTIYPSYRVTGPWGQIEADQVLVAPDGATLTVPGPIALSDRTITGAGWRVTLAPGWRVEPGPRADDWRVVEAR